MSKPTKKEIKTAIKVLRSFEKKANKLATNTEQEYPHEVARGLEVWLEILESEDPDFFADYEEEYTAGH